MRLLKLTTYPIFFNYGTIIDKSFLAKLKKDNVLFALILTKLYEKLSYENPD